MADAVEGAGRCPRHVRSATTFQPKELRRRARRETNGRVDLADCSLIANALGRHGPGRGCASGRDGPPDAPGLGHPVQRTGHRRSARPAQERPAAPGWTRGSMASLRALVLRGPDPERDGVSTWRAKDLCRIVEAALRSRLQRERDAPAAPRPRPVLAEDAADPSRSRSQGAGPLQKKFSDADRRGGATTTLRPSGSRSGSSTKPGSARPVGAVGGGSSAGMRPRGRARPPPPSGLSVRGRLPGARRWGRPGPADGRRRRHAGHARRARPGGPPAVPMPWS